MRFDIFTLFPGLFASPFAESMVKRAADAGIVEIHTHNIRAYATDKHQVTDDVAYGGGGGMVMKPEPIFRAVESVLGLPATTEDGRLEFGNCAKSTVSNLQPSVPIILMSPAGRRFSHTVAKDLASHKRIALICGHYEGVDERVREHLCTDEISIGDFVLTGGELPAMVIVDAVARLLPGMLPPGIPDKESHALGAGQLEYPHYTRPAEFRGWRVPEVLLSGNHAKIEQWRREQAALKTRIQTERKD